MSVWTTRPCASVVGSSAKSVTASNAGVRPNRSLAKLKMSTPKPTVKPIMNTRGQNDSAENLSGLFSQNFSMCAHRSSVDPGAPMI